MKVIIYDMSDDKVPQIILRLVDDTGCLRVQSPIYGNADFARNLGEVLAGAFDTELTWLGPSMLSVAVKQLVDDQHFADGLRQRALF
jgi:hypothetical protein